MPATVEIFHRGTRVWVHPRSHVPGRHTTVAEHMPKAHRAHLEWSLSRLVHWGASIGPDAATLVQQILESRPHPEQGYRTIYRRLPRLFEELTLAHADGSYIALLTRLARVDVLVLDDWGLAAITDRHRRDLPEVIDDRDGARSTVITSQLPREQWHDYLGDPTVADAIVDRLVHRAHALKLKGPSKRPPETAPAAGT